MRNGSNSIIAANAIPTAKPCSALKFTHCPPNDARECMPRRGTGIRLTTLRMHTLAMTLLALLTLLSCAHAIKFELPASAYPEEMCIWNAAHRGELIIVTAIAAPAIGQHDDLEIREREGCTLDLNKKNIPVATSLPVPTH